jgi:alkylhydroperoxidase family enzyme
MKMLPGAGAAAVEPSRAAAAPSGTGAVMPVDPPAASRPAVTLPTRQLSEMPRDELAHLAEEYGLDPTAYKSRQHLVVALHERRQMIAALDRDAMLDVIRWGRRPVTVNATKEQIAQEIVRIPSMKFAGLSQRGLVVLARMRGIGCLEQDMVPVLIKRLKRQEGLFSRINRKRRAMLGSLVSKIVGDDAAATDYQFLPGDTGAGHSASTHSHPGATTVASAPTSTSIKEEIEESGLFGGITSRIKKSADAYVNQKLDEIEARIDRKLDEIDRRLAEWRDKEIANRLRILKITLWASVIVAAVSLIYAYVKVYFVS